MLVLTRKTEDEVIIGENIRIKILGVHRDKVQIGIMAPPEISILRGELKERSEQFVEEEVLINN